VWKNLEHAHKTRPPKSKTPAPVAAMPKEEDGESKELIDKDGIKYQKAGKVKKESKHEELRKEMYQGQVEDKVFNPGPRAKYDATRLKEQTACEHRFEDMRWGANSTSLYASCNACGLKSCIVYTKKEPKEAYMMEAKKEDAKEIFVVKLTPGVAILDTGCRAPVGGPTWHKELQQELRKRGVTFRSRRQREYFQFGPGDPILSTKKWRYEVGVQGQKRILGISELPIDCPGLIGPDVLKLWEIKLDFAEDTIETGKAGPQKIAYSSSGHPIAGLLDFGEPNMVFPVEAKEAAAMVFPVEAKEAAAAAADSSDSDTDPEMPDRVSDTDSDSDMPAGVDVYEESSDTESDRDEEVSGLTELMKLLNATRPPRKLPEHYNIASDDNHEDDEDSSSEESMHAHTESSDSSGTEDSSEEEAYQVAVAKDEKWLNKGAKRHIRSNLKGIAEAMKEECVKVKADREARQQQRYDMEVETPLKHVPGRARKPGPWRMIEIFTWTCMVSIIAAGMGWMTYQPITLPDFDMRDPVDRQRAREYLEDIDPDFVMLAQPCLPWTQLQNINQRTPQQCRDLQEKREADRPLLLFTEEVVHWQEARGRAVGSESPDRAASWKEPPMVAAFSSEGMSSARCDMCAHGKRRPDTGEHVRKPTMVKGTPEVCSEVECRCPGNHSHAPIEGSMRAEVDGKLRSVKVSEWAGGYTKEFARKLVRGAERYLQKGTGICFPVDTDQCSPEEAPTVQEENFTFPGDEMEHDWSGNEIPPKDREDILRRIPKSVRQEVRKSHNGLGHPTRPTLLRMMKLGGASPAAMEYAKVWQCPTCDAAAQPSEPLKASTRIRPFGFNKTVGVDLKYLKDTNRDNHVAVSLVDAGTGWHVMSLLKNRTPRHVVEQILQVWIKHYGVPELFIIDQGGEFEGEFIAMCEEYGIDTRLTGAQAGWQHGLTERHGGIFGATWDKVVQQFDIQGRDQVKTAIAICCQAKNATLTRNGLTPEQAVFGRALRWTESNNKDDDEVLMAALGTDGEAWKAAQIRSAAKIAMISKDASDKVRRAMMRKAPKVLTELTPGTRVYFWSPHPMKGRRRTDSHRWRGPATVVARESPGRYFISWRGRICLAAKDQLRMATSIEAAAAEEVATNATVTAENMGEDKSYADVTNVSEPPKFRKTKQTVLKKNRSAPRVKAFRVKAPVVDVSKPLTEPTQASEPEEAQVVPALEAPQPQQPEAQQSAQQGDIEVDALEDFIREFDEDLLALATTQAKRPRALRTVLDDVPGQMKRQRTAYQQEPQGAGQLPMIAMMCTIGAEEDEWLNGSELDSMSSLMGKRVKGVRVHTELRRKLYDHAQHKDCNRLSVMMSESGAANMKDDGEERQRKKMPTSWVGLTIFYHDKPDENVRDIYYLDSPEGLLEMNLNFEEAENVTSVYESWSKGLMRPVQEAFLLKLKPSGKELEPKHFNRKEAKSFAQADAEEWRQWVANKTVDTRPVRDEKKIPKTKIITAPMRYVRTNRAKMWEEMIAKSRLIIPGHKDPQIGLYRTDAPTTSGLAVLVVAALAACLDWAGMLFDVSTAFLSD